MEKIKRILKIFKDQILLLRKKWKMWKYRKCKECPIINMKLVKLNDIERESVFNKMRELHE